MSTYDDEPIEFDFFDEPETVETTQRRRLPRLEMPGGRGGGGDDGRPPRRPVRTPTGLVPLARLVGLVAIAIVIVVGLVFWIGSCQGQSKHDEYAAYAEKVNAIAKTSRGIATDFSQKFLSTNLKQADFESTLQQYAQQEQQSYQQVQQIRPPGPLRAAHQNLVNAVQLRYQGFSQLGDALARANLKKSGAAEALAREGALLSASDVVWENLYRIPATEQMQNQGVKGVVIPASQIVPNPDLVSSRSFQFLVSGLGGASTSGNVTGKHGDGIVGTRVTPQGTDLSPTSATTVNVSADLAFNVTVENSGDFPETNVPVTLTINAGGKPIKKTETIQGIESGQQKTVTFTNFNLPSSAFGQRATVKVAVAPVAGEKNLSNNTSTYTVFFTLPAG
jgi:hypothetical protein